MSLNLASKKFIFEVDEIRLTHAIQNGIDGQNMSPRPRPNILPLRGRSKKSLDSNGNAATSPRTPETALDSLGRSQGDRLLAMKVRSQHAPHGSLSFHSSHSPSTPRGNLFPDTPSFANGRLYTTNKHTHPPSPFPTSSRSSAATAYVTSPRFSSPTTPIKPLSVSSPMSSPRTRIVGRSLASGTISPAPISRVVVASGKGTVKGVTPSNKSSSSLRKLTAGARLRPYPTQGARIEMPATADAPTSAYDLRSRFVQTASQMVLPEAALHLPPNTEALVGAKRKKQPS